MSMASVDYRKNWDLHPTEAKWFAVRTPSKWEKKVADRLDMKGISVYLPLQKRRVKYSGQKAKTIVKPLISSFVFVQIVESEYSKVYETEGVAFFLKDAGALKAIPEKEMEHLRFFVGEKVRVQDAKFEPGDEVEVIVGEFSGTRGRWVQGKNRSYFVVNLFFLGKEMLVEIPTSHIRKLK